MRAANSSVALSASMPATSWCSPSGFPPISRVCANAVISSTSRCAAPTQRAATIIRSNRNQSWVNVIGSPSAPDQMGGRNSDVVERDDRVLVGDVVRIVRCANDFHPRPRQIDHQQHVVTGVLTGRQHRLDEDVVGEVVRRDVPLDPVDHILVAVAACGGLQCRNVGPGELLGDRVRLVLLAAHRRQQPALQLVVGGHLGPPLRRRAPSPRRGRWSPAHTVPAPAPAAGPCSPARPPTSACSWRTDPGRCARLECSAVSSLGSRPPANSASTSCGINDSTKARAVSWIRRSSSVSPYIEIPPLLLLTERSVYASVP